ncbi:MULTISPECIES: hypothetical protein [Psychrobacter]|uniref:Uncharacterized protein n=1 Tax=Psychrobacter halodurans TaxID=2818439 RepID=A0AAW4IPN4_9GAMM|nr:MULTISPECIES: hypothetical protein [Psychrobacter]MBO1517428.1 hypothetical protein [Psychrobacter halodurans]HCH27791.1 hypothetical protein [Psychrobacter sp.]
MRTAYEEKRIPLQIRRLMLFNEICRKAKKYPDEIVQLAGYSKIAFTVTYSKKDKKYTAFGGVFKYAHTRQEVIEKGLDKLPHDELVMCALTVKRQAFTKASRTPLGLLIEWNKHVKNKPFKCIKDNIDTFFKVNDELETDYPPHRFYERLVASAYLPLWGDNQA